MYPNSTSEIAMWKERTPLQSRKKYIRLNKSSAEIPLRLKLIKRVKNQKLLNDLLEHHHYDEYLVTHSRKVKALHREECPNCPWNEATIFVYYDSKKNIYVKRPEKNDKSGTIRKIR